MCMSALALEENKIKRSSFVCMTVSNAKTSYISLCVWDRSAHQQTNEWRDAVMCMTAFKIKNRRLNICVRRLVRCKFSVSTWQHLIAVCLRRAIVIHMTLKRAVVKFVDTIHYINIYSGRHLPVLLTVQTIDLRVVQKDSRSVWSGVKAILFSRFQMKSSLNVMILCEFCFLTPSVMKCNKHVLAAWTYPQSTNHQRHFRYHHHHRVVIVDVRAPWPVCLSLIHIWRCRRAT